MCMVKPKKNDEDKIDVLKYGNIRRFDAQQRRNFDNTYEPVVQYWTGFCDGVKMQLASEAKK